MSSIWFEFKFIFSKDGNEDNIEISDIWFPQIFKIRIFFGSLLFILVKINSGVNFFDIFILLFN